MNNDERPDNRNSGLKTLSFRLTSTTASYFKALKSKIKRANMAEPLLAAAIEWLRLPERKWRWIATGAITAN